ncbi:MAG: hypothetical protein MJZ32_02720 [Bacteroidaceae bacterium]|nr:hypothetical protein [Bacteroidaceae bacterium]
MKHKYAKESVMIRRGLYSTTIYEMEVWSLANDNEYSEEDYLEQLKSDGCMSCGLHKEKVGLFETKERALDCLNMISEDPWDSDRDLYCTFIREKAMYCLMNQRDYLKEWTYIYSQLHDESLVRNYAEDENPFLGRPKDMVRFKHGDIVMVADNYDGHWGIVYGSPITKEEIKDVNERIEKETGMPGTKYSIMDWSDDSYLILTNEKGFNGGHEHILAHHVIPPLSVPGVVRSKLEEGLQKTSIR